MSGKNTGKNRPASFETWFKTTDLQITSDGTANILVPNQFFADFIEEHFSSLIEETLKDSNISFCALNFKPIEKDWKIIQPLSEEIAEAQSKKYPRPLKP
jgi:chromosomal replication initiation ATPase DnaA